jgi:hypothetical protein
MAAGLHIAGGGDENHRALIAFQQRVSINSTPLPSGR